MKKALLIFFAVCFLSGCASINPFEVPQGEGAYLKNREEFKGQSYFVYDFINASTIKDYKSFEPDATTATYDAVYQIPSEEMTIALKILYYPKRGPVSSVGEALATSFGIFTSQKARSRFNDATTVYEIWVINPKRQLVGLEGIKLNATKGQTYQANCKIEGGKAYVWLENNEGERVTETVRGIGVTKRFEYFVWQNLPSTTP